MNYLKMLGLTAVAVAALMAFAGAAPATTLTSPTGTTYPTGSKIRAELKEGEWILKSSFIGEVKCKESIVEGTISSQGAGQTAKGSVSTLEFTSCNGLVTVLKSGTLEVHSTSGYNGTFRSSGAEVTVELFGLHCIFTTSNTHVGAVTGGAPATWTATNSSIPRTGGRSGAFCGSSAAMSAVYKVTTPNPFYIDA